MQFTEAQLAAIAHREGHLQLIACAGSGKTEVVARRIAALFEPVAGAPKVAPRNVIAFTFTEKAAAELKERIVSRVREKLGDLPGLAEMYVGTIHGFCLDLLQNEVPALLKYSVLNEVQQALAVDRYSNQSGLASTTTHEGKPLSRYVNTDHYIKALDILRQADIDASKLEGSTVANGLALYRKLLESKSWFDYTAIMDTAVRVLAEDEDVKARLAARVRHVIVDEYQDVNPIQEKVVRALADLGANLCVVGDDDQTIYQWNGADVSNILTFADRYPRTSSVRLEENFRSSRAVVELARDFVAQNTRRLPKAMKSTDAQPHAEGDVLALALKDPDDEADFVARTIKSLRGTTFADGATTRGLSWSDMAVLVRSNLRKNAAALRAAFEREGIPFIVQGMNTLFDTREANAARALFYFMVKQDDIDADQLRAAWKNALLGCDDDEIERGISLAIARKTSLETVGDERRSTYNIQRLFLDFIEAIALREERVPDGRGEVVFYNLGQFSQLISDFETIHFHSEPKDKYQAFAGFLKYGADGEYAEGVESNAHARPDAVQILTMHRAKGLQWPVVFVPGVLRNRFPASGRGGMSAWHIVPKGAVRDEERYRGSVEDERRLFYVALTRAQRYLFVTHAPVPGNKLAQKPSEFFEWMQGSKWVKRIEKGFSERPRTTPAPRRNIANVTFSFSELKYFFECPYQFKLRILYGFNAPIAESLGYGKSLHDALAEVHKRAIEGEITGTDRVPALLDTHLHLPYAYPSLKDKLRESAAKILHNYLLKNASLLEKLEFAEKPIEISLGNGVSIAGRVDLVYRRDTRETSIVDLKSTERAQAEDVTETQLHIYALGYRELTGRQADFVEIWELDEDRKKPRAVDQDFIDGVTAHVQRAASALRTNELPARAEERKCGKCDYCRMCSAGSVFAKE